MSDVKNDRILEIYLGTRVTLCICFMCPACFVSVRVVKVSFTEFATHPSQPFFLQVVSKLTIDTV